MLISDKLSIMWNGIHLFTSKNKKHIHQKRNGETTAVKKNKFQLKREIEP